MYEVGDTIVAVSSSGGSGAKTIIRISGPEAFSMLDAPPQADSILAKNGNRESRIEDREFRIDEKLRTEAKVYLFCGPYSYTGDDLAEIHICANPSVVEGIIKRLLSLGVRAAGPGEFTARAYLNGKIDLAQAEAVAEVVASGNRFQLAAAERLLAGKLAETISKVREEMVEAAGLIEAGLDFSGEDIEFITASEAIERIGKIRSRLEDMRGGSIYDEAMIDMPAVGIAGSRNAGKSSLLNALLCQDRSIVSEKAATTRDVLTGILRLKNWDCVLFDCAGLIRKPVAEGFAGGEKLWRRSEDILDELAQAAAIEALNSAAAVILCVDISKGFPQTRTNAFGGPKEDYSNDIGVLELIRPNQLIWVATKCDCFDAKKLTAKIAELEDLIRGQLLLTSAKTGQGLGRLRDIVDRTVTQLRENSAESADRIAITERHRQVVEEAIVNLSEAINEMRVGNDEVASMLLRASWRGLSNIEGERIDDVVLERIFSQFCVGK